MLYFCGMKTSLIRFAVVIAITTGSLFSTAFAQSQSQVTTRNLYYTAKVWGYLKYFHPAVNGCNKNLDSILVALIPEIESDSTSSLLNISLLKMFAYAGPMPSATTPPPSLTPDETINLNLAWQNDTALSPEVQALLDSIRVNFRPVQSCYYEWNTNPTSANPYPYLTTENDYPIAIAITEPYQLLTLFRAWNQYNYFYPYKTLLDSSWDSTLLRMIPICQASETSDVFYLALLQFQARLQDAHATANSQIFLTHFGYYFLPMLFRYIDSQTVITKVFQGVTQVKPGDVVLKIDGMPTQAIRDSLWKYTPGGNAAVINRNICTQLLDGTSRVATLVVDDGTGPRTVLINRSAFGAEVYDSIDSWQGDGSHWKILPGNIGYVNLGIADSNDLKTLFPALKNTAGIIFDLRNYPYDFLIYKWCDSLMPSSAPFVKWFFPDPTYPGTGYSNVTNCGPIPSNPNYYKGKVIILVNEITQSQAEFTAMALSQAPKSLIVGSQTAGADGDVAGANYPTETFMYYTSWGVSYADGTQTQRVGIIPNVVIRPTIADVRAGIDPVLDTAIILAGGRLAVTETSPSPLCVNAFPNPATNSTTIHFTSPEEAGYASITIVNALGAEVARVFSGEVSEGEHSVSWNVPAGLSPGMYECIVRMNGQVERTGIVVE